jgi:hypothetical protein
VSVPTKPNPLKKQKQKMGGKKITNFYLSATKSTKMWYFSSSLGMGGHKVTIT